MHAARRPLIAHLPLIVGNRYRFPDGTSAPAVRGGATDDGADDGQPTTLPDDITAVDDAELQTLEDALMAEFDALVDAKSNDIPAMERIASDVEAVRAEADRRITEAAEAETKRAELASRIHAQADDDGDDDGDDGDDPGDGDPAADGGDGDAAPAKGKEKESVTASAAKPARKPVSAGATARRTTRPSAPDTTPRVVITAAADLPGVATGAAIDLTQVAESMHDKARAMSNGGARAPIARFTLPYAKEDIVNPRTSKDGGAEILDRVANQSNLVMPSLTAAGGWCTPSQNLYDLLALDGATGLLDLPSMGIERGGVNVPSYIGIDAADGALWSWSEGQDADVSVAIADLDVVGGVGTMNTTGAHQLVVGDMVEVTTGNPLANGPWTVTGVTDADTATLAMPGVPDLANLVGNFLRQKGCFTIPCPTWTDVRLGAYGFCVKHGNLSERAMPELTRRYIALVINAHQHRLSSINLSKIRLQHSAAPVTVTAVGSDSYGELMSAVELSVVDYRSQHKISDRVIIEILLPSWTQEVLRSNLAMRAGVDLLAVGDAQINAHLAARNVRAQFLEDYQPMWNGAPRQLWPTSMEFVIYPAGNFVEGNGGTLDLGVTRDSRLNATNDFTAAWTEDFRLLARRGPLARRVTATLSTDGVTACCP